LEKKNKELQGKVDEAEREKRRLTEQKEETEREMKRNTTMMMAMAFNSAFQLAKR